MSEILKMYDGIFAAIGFLLFVILILIAYGIYAKYTGEGWWLIKIIRKEIKK